MSFKGALFSPGIDEIAKKLLWMIAGWSPRCNHKKDSGVPRARLWCSGGIKVDPLSIHHAYMLKCIRLHVYMYDMVFLRIWRR